MTIHSSVSPGEFNDEETWQVVSTGQQRVGHCAKHTSTEFPKPQ